MNETSLEEQPKAGPDDACDCKVVFSTLLYCAIYSPRETILYQYFYIFWQEYKKTDLRVRM
jgi:hypothetical protein